MTNTKNNDGTQSTETTNPFEAAIQANMKMWQDSMSYFNQFSSNNGFGSFSSNRNAFGNADSSMPKNKSNDDGLHNHTNTSEKQKNDLNNISQRFFHESLKRATQSNHTGQSMMFDLMENWRQFTTEVMDKNPTALLEQHMNLWQQQLQLYQNTMMKIAGNQAEPVISPERGDKRFQDDDWSSHPVFDFLKQSYLLTTNNMMDTIENAKGIDDKTRQRLAFFTRQWANAIAPSNFLWSNPEVLRLTIETGGQNLIQGMKQLTEDMEKSSDVLNIRMTDQSAFRLGENIATTKGKVVFRNRMFELIQYTPTTEKVSQRPLLIVPPWINKFYIIDLKEKNSYIRWALEEGHTVFVMSWVNPTKAYKDVGMETYMHEGLLTALDTIKEITGEPDANVIGYCIGGWLLALTLSWLTENDQAERIASATFWTTIFNFNDPGDIGVFIDEKMVNALTREEKKQGIFDGRLMSVAFSLLRENSLYWNYYIQNYLKGERPMPFDLLYWNSDCTNVTADLHQFLLRELYLNNKLIKQGELLFDGVKIDLSKVTTPVYVVSTLQDHIAKWKSCYASTQVMGGDVTFVLGESGHIAGIINPPAGKYGYYIHHSTPNPTETTYPSNPDEWFQNAEKHDESWWLHWSNWINKYRGQEINSRHPGINHTGKASPILCDAPGKYVHVKADEALKSE